MSFALQIGKDVVNVRSDYDRVSGVFSWDISLNEAHTEKLLGVFITNASPQIPEELLTGDEFLDGHHDAGENSAPEDLSDAAPLGLVPLIHVDEVETAKVALDVR